MTDADAPVRCTEKGEKVIAPLQPPLPLHAHAHYSSERGGDRDRALSLGRPLAWYRSPNRASWAVRFHLAGEGGRTTPRPSPVARACASVPCPFPSHACLSPSSVYLLPLALSGRLSIYLSARTRILLARSAGSRLDLDRMGSSFPWRAIAVCKTAGIGRNCFFRRAAPSLNVMKRRLRRLCGAASPFEMEIPP